MGLGDNFREFFCMLTKSALGVGLSEPQTEIDYLAIKLHAGSKISKGELTSVMNMHEKISEHDNGLPRKVRKRKENLSVRKEDG